MQKASREGAQIKVASAVNADFVHCRFCSVLYGLLGARQDLLGQIKTALDVELSHLEFEAPCQQLLTYRFAGWGINKNQKGISTIK